MIPGKLVGISIGGVPILEDYRPHPRPEYRASFTVKIKTSPELDAFMRDARADADRQMAEHIETALAGIVGADHDLARVTEHPMRMEGESVIRRVYRNDVEIGRVLCAWDPETFVTTIRWERA